MNTSHLPSPEVAAERFARRITARLTEGTGTLPYDISERLRATRVQAVAKRKRTLLVPHTAPVVAQSGSSAALGWWGSEGGNWWRALLSAVPVLALVAGLVVINLSQDEHGTTEVAEVDAALLTDDLPPAAYADPGFAQFLKIGATQSN
ncbi:DUF3619 family protein [Simplicispira psychrophila]|uniref:DUF3619 family protein n=1 Tax=Simplicispira psychrophila TaxID=80882 RepID=UPI0004806768|nr:DUF3619 family protein [Simplicispira psychrophila]